MRDNATGGMQGGAQGDVTGRGPGHGPGHGTGHGPGRRRRNWAVLATLVLVGLAGAKRWQMSEPGDVGEYQAKVREAWEATPSIVGDWIGSDVALPQAAVQLLRPNATLSRRYRNLMTGEVVDILAVHCGDARDMEGHYPPNCYPGQGYSLKSQVKREWRGGAVHGTAYEFGSWRLNAPSGLWVAGTFAVKGSGTSRDMREMRLDVRKASTRHYGVAQFQVAMSPTMPERRREELAELFFGVLGRMIDTVEDSGTVVGGAAGGVARAKETNNER